MRTLRQIISLATTVTAAAAVLGTLLLLCLRVLTHAPFFDECLHVRYLWLVAQGLVPHLDFSCIYAPMTYLATRDVIGVVGGHAYTYLVLRFIMAGLMAGAGAICAWHGRRMAGAWLWGCLPFCLVVALPLYCRTSAEYSADRFAMLAAVAALAILFTPPTAGRVAAAAALSVVSVAFTPKYTFILACGGAAYTLGACHSRAGAARVLAAGAAGLAAAAGAVWLYYGAHGLSFGATWTWVYRVQSQYSLAHGEERLWRALLPIAARYWAVSAVLLGGAAAVVVRTRSTGLRASAGSLGVLAGVLCHAIVIRGLHEQYTLPVFVALAFCAPAAAVVLRERVPDRMPFITAALAAFVLLCTLIRFPVAAAEFRLTLSNTRDEFKVLATGLYKTVPAFLMLRSMQQLLNAIPAGERVVAMWKCHPTFRTDLTFITVDDRPSGLDSLPHASPIRRFFSPAYFRQMLERHPPAYINLTYLDVNYPIGWLEVCQAFIASRSNLYTAVKFSDTIGYIRNDLVAQLGRARAAPGGSP